MAKQQRFNLEIYQGEKLKEVVKNKSLRWLYDNYDLYNSYLSPNRKGKLRQLSYWALTNKKYLDKEYQEEYIFNSIKGNKKLVVKLAE